MNISIHHTKKRKAECRYTCFEEVAAFVPDFVRSIGHRINPVEKLLASDLGVKK